MNDMDLHHEEHASSNNAPVSQEEFTTLQTQLQKVVLLLQEMGPFPTAPTTVHLPRP